MSNIAQTISINTTLKEIQFYLSSHTQRLNDHDTLLRELRQHSTTTTTKAELHAVMASLTYKSMGLSLTNETMTEIIQKKCSTMEQIRPSDLQGYLSNPFEALSSMGKKSITFCC